MSSNPEVVIPWFNSSSNDGSSCVDVQKLADGTVQVRNSNYPDGAVLDFTPAEIAAFLAGAKDGEFDVLL